MDDYAISCTTEDIKSAKPGTIPTDLPEYAESGVHVHTLLDALNGDEGKFSAESWEDAFVAFRRIVLDKWLEIKIHDKELDPRRAALLYEVRVNDSKRVDKLPPKWESVGAGFIRYAHLGKISLDRFAIAHLEEDQDGVKLSDPVSIQIQLNKV